MRELEKLRSALSHCAPVPTVVTVSKLVAYYATKRTTGPEFKAIFDTEAFSDKNMMAIFEDTGSSYFKSVEALRKGGTNIGKFKVVATSKQEAVAKLIILANANEKRDNIYSLESTRCMNMSILTNVLATVSAFNLSSPAPSAPFEPFTTGPFKSARSDSYIPFRAQFERGAEAYRAKLERDAETSDQAKKTPKTNKKKIEQEDALNAVLLYADLRDNEAFPDDALEGKRLKNAFRKLFPPVTLDGENVRAGSKILLFGTSQDSMEKFVEDFNSIDLKNKDNAEIMGLIAARRNKQPVIEAFKSRTRARMTKADFD
jgi:hypothetical protein